ncbi:hypothetical protein B9T62_18645 [Paenibacillus donghaensis]|uniref:Uncharacterized protein n=1 Tax=Paenibacillus donghaensis TaxID=414771 RepID=A0A2Z2KAU6_9BACL|nr:hypothetical protein B9T62_18645 [Paenibacillus donghaensis]
MRKSKAPITQCPHCNSSEGYYIKEQVSGTVHYRTNFDGSEADNTEVYDYLKHRSGKLAFCINCNKKIFKVEELT